MFEPVAAIVDVIGKIPGSQAILVCLFLVFSIVAGNGVFILHFRRRGRSAWSIFDPSSFPLFKFNGIEWLLLALVFLVSLAIGMLAVSAGPQPAS